MIFVNLWMDAHVFVEVCANRKNNSGKRDREGERGREKREKEREFLSNLNLMSC